MSEEFYEEGIVKDVKDGLASVIVNESSACESCAAKVVCKTGDEDSKILTAKDPIGVHQGDKVRVAVKGKNILAASFLLYGLPLILFLAGIFAGLNYFSSQKELWGTILGFGLIAVYAVILSFLSNKNINKNKLIPEIIFVSKRT